MAMSMRKQVAQNKRNTIFIMIGFVAFITVVGAIFSWLTGRKSLVYYFAFISFGYALFQYFLSDKIAIASAGARQTTREENPRLYNIVESLAKDAKLPMPKVYIINDPAPNAFATGRDPAHACVAATTGMLEVMNDRELRAVMGHEISHVRNYDIRVSMIAFGLTSLVGLISDFGLRMFFYSSDPDDDNQSPIGILVAILTAILAPIVATIVQLAVSRQREYLADASSANLIGSPEDMASALRKLDLQTRPMRQQNVSSESMYITNPLNKSFLSNLFSTHPSITSRIERLESMK